MVKGLEVLYIDVQYIVDYVLKRLEIQTMCPVPYLLGSGRPHAPLKFRLHKPGDT